MLDAIIIWIKNNNKKAIALFVIHFPVVAFYGDIFIKFNYVGHVVLDKNHVGYAILSYLAGVVSLPFATIVVTVFAMFIYMAIKIIYDIITSIYFIKKYGNVNKVINSIICRINNIDSVKIESYKYREYDKEEDCYCFDNENCPPKHIIEYGYKITGIPSSKIPYMNYFFYREFKQKLLIKLTYVLKYDIDEHTIINDAIDIVSDNKENTLGGVLCLWKVLQKKVLHNY